MKDSGGPAHENSSSVLYQPKSVLHFHFPIILMTLLSALPFPPGYARKSDVKPPLPTSTSRNHQHKEAIYTLLSADFTPDAGCFQ